MSKNKIILIITYVCAALAFIADISTPSGYAEWFLYLIPFVILSLNFESLAIYLLAAFSSILMVLGFKLSESLVPFSVGLTNLIAAELSLWGFTFFLVNHTKLYNNYRNTTILDEAIFESMNEGLIVVDLKGNIKSVNKAALEISGSKTPEQCRCMLYSQDLCEIYDSEGNKLPLEKWPYSRVMRLERFDAEIYEIRKKDRTESWFGSFSGTPVYNQKGAPMLVLLTFRDVTEIKKGEIALKQEHAVSVQRAEEAEEKGRILKALLTHIPEAIFITRKENVEIFYASQYSCELLGLDMKEIIGSTDKDRPQKWNLQKIDGKTVAQSDELPMSRAILYEEIIDDQEWIINRRDGQRRVASVDAAPIRDSEGNIIGSISSWRDVTDRKKTESERERLMAELTQQHELLEQIIENARVAVALFKGEEFRFVLGNSRFDFFAKGEKVNRTAKEIWAENEMFWLSEFKNVYTNNEISVVNDRSFIKETASGPGEALYSILFVPFRFNDGVKGVLVIARETTAEVQDRKVIEQTAVRDEAILNSLTDGLIISDPSGNILKMNSAALQMYGLKSSDEVNNQMRDFSQVFKFHDSDGNPLPFGKLPFSRALRKEKFSAMDIMVHRGDPNKLWYASYSGAPVMDKDGNLILVILTIRDVTELRLRTREAVEAKRILDAIMDYTPNVMLIAAGPIGVVVRASKSMSNLLEIPLDKIQGDVEHPEDWKMNRAGSIHDDFKTMPLYRAINNGEIIKDEEWVIRRDGNEIYLSLDVGPILDEKGKIEAGVSTWRDVTERKRVEKERERLNSQLRQRASELENTNRELEAFAYSVSHDLRAPLRTIIGFISIIQEDYGAKFDEAGLDYLSRIKAGAQKMNELIEDMLRLSRITRQEMVFQQVDLGSIVSSILDELKRSAPERKTEFLVQSNVIVEADPKLIQIALENLLRNSWKFTARKEVTRIEFGVSVKDDIKEYFIKDNGAGFDMRFAERLFQPFQRLHSDKEFSGTGIGLAIVQRVIRRHGGNIRAEGEVNKGAAFYFTLG